MSKLLLLCVKVGDTLVHKCYVIKFIVSLISLILKFWCRNKHKMYKSQVSHNEIFINCIVLYNFYKIMWY